MASNDIRVIEFMPGITVESFEKDEDFVIWTKTDEMAGKVRIERDYLKEGRTYKEYMWVKSFKLDKLDNRTIVYSPDKMPAPVESPESE